MGGQLEAGELHPTSPRLFCQNEVIQINNAYLFCSVTFQGLGPSRDPIVHFRKCNLQWKAGCTLYIIQTFPHSHFPAIVLEMAGQDLIFVVPCIMLNSEIIPTRCNNCVYSSQWLYSTCFGWQGRVTPPEHVAVWPQKAPPQSSRDSRRAFWRETTPDNIHQHHGYNVHVTWTNKYFGDAYG